MAKHFGRRRACDLMGIAVLVTVVDKYSDRKHGVQFTSVESKNIQRYCGGWREAVHAVHERIQQDFQYKAVSVFNMVGRMDGELMGSLRMRCRRIMPSSRRCCRA